MGVKRQRQGEPIRVDLEYPRIEGQPNRIEIELVDVRAANAISVRYDFERDGWAIESDMADPDDPGAEEESDEVAFIPAWPRAGGRSW